MTFENQLDALLYLHLDGFESGRDLLQALDESDFARREIAPTDGIKKSSFFEVLNTRSLEQLAHVFNGVLARARDILPRQHPGLRVAGDRRVLDRFGALHGMRMYQTGFPYTPVASIATCPTPSALRIFALGAAEG